MAKTSYDAPAARNAIRLIEELCLSDKPLGVREIGRRLDLNSNMVFRLLKTLEAGEWLVTSDGGAKYTVGLRPFHFISKPVKRMTLVRAARDPLYELWEKSGQSCYLGIIRGTRTLFLEHMDAVDDVRLVANPGGLYLMHCAAPGKALLAFSDEDFVAKVIKEEGLPVQTRHTIKSQTALKKELAQIRKRGYALDLEEYAEGLICLAAPIFNYDEKLVGTIGLSVLTLYYSPERLEKELGPLVVSAARRITSALGAPIEVNAQ